MGLRWRNVIDVGHVEGGVHGRAAEGRSRPVVTACGGFLASSLGSEEGGVEGESSG